MVPGAFLRRKSTAKKNPARGWGLGGKQVNSLQQLRRFPIPTELSFLQRGNAAETKRPPRGGLVPPSPWLSARITTTTYLMATTSVMARTPARAPRGLSSPLLRPWLLSATRGKRKSDLCRYLRRRRQALRSSQSNAPAAPPLQASKRRRSNSLQSALVPHRLVPLVCLGHARGRGRSVLIQLLRRWYPPLPRRVAQSAFRGRSWSPARFDARFRN